jgi:conserved oligomeric Golgi complex subunit 6
MTSTYFEEVIESPHDGTATPSTPFGSASSSAKASAISSKITTLLSSSFADADIRDALAILDARGVKNNAETRRNLRQDAQKEIIDCNAEIVADFGTVAEVWHLTSSSVLCSQKALSNSNGLAR